jgi:hypothetical protein
LIAIDVVLNWFWKAPFLIQEIEAIAAKANAKVVSVVLPRLRSNASSKTTRIAKKMTSQVAPSGRNFRLAYFRSDLNTLTDLTRQRVFFVLIFALILISSSVLWRASLSKSFKSEGCILGALDFHAVLRSLPRPGSSPEHRDRTIYTILAKPVPRFEYLLGSSSAFSCFSLLARS